MARFLSPAWLEEVQGAVAAGGANANVPRGVAFTLRQVVRGGPDGEIAYAVRFGDGVIRFSPGGGEGADIEVTSEYDTAVSISKGEVSPAVALASGALRVQGRVELLSQHRDAWLALDDMLAPVRADTEY